MKRSVWIALLAAALSITVAISAAMQEDQQDVDVSVEADVSSTTQVDGTVDAVRHSDLPTIAVDELPPEAVHVLGLIDAGGPYPYDQDGTVFQNREGILPDEPEGSYHEYTVDTPGSDDRGPRRIVTGPDDDEAYYTDDHYDSFREIVP